MFPLYAFRKQTQLIFIAESKSVNSCSVYQTAGISSLQGVVRENKAPSGNPAPKSCASSLDTNWPQTNSVLASISLLAKVRKGEADHAVFPEGLENLQKAFGKFSRIENTAGGRRVVLCFQS